MLSLAVEPALPDGREIIPPELLSGITADKIDWERGTLIDDEGRLWIDCLLLPLDGVEAIIGSEKNSFMCSVGERAIKRSTGHLGIVDGLVKRTHFEPEMSAVADRHYSRRTIGARQFCPQSRAVNGLTSTTLQKRRARQSGNATGTNLCFLTAFTSVVSHDGKRDLVNTCRRCHH